MSTKIRNKSAAHNNINSHNITTGGIENGNNVGQNSSQSLLKIESVVPKLTSRTLKLNKLTKSHSTLTSAYIKKVNESKRTFVVSKQDGGHAGNDGSIFVNNGIYTIKRNPKEKEKLPDRINLDRKGLTMIPVIEEEPNLRLLSLQHNLINVFHIPVNTELIIKDNVSSPPKDINVSASNGNAVNNTVPTMRHPPLTRQLTRQRSVTTRNPLVLNNNSISYMGNNKLGLGGNNNQTNSTANNSTFLQKTLLLNAQSKHILKKSNSFINNYPNFLTATTAATTPYTMSQIQKGQAQFMKPRLVHTPSLSVDNLLMGNGHGEETNTPTPDTARSTNGVVIDSPPATEIKHNLGNLVFLDLYDNQIEVIANLDGLKSLTVLLLGKNRISDISGLASVKHTLRVLDLHGNKIVNISQKISPLQELKSLNLAGNQLKQVHDKDFSGLYALKELNLKRNKIRKIVGFEDLRSLERLWLCHNELQRVEDMSSIARATNLKEVTIENNPVSLAGDCVSFLVSYLPNLNSLSQMQITEQVRRAAMAWRKNKEASDTNYLNLTSDVCQSMRREEIISNARTNWELLRSQQSTLTLKHTTPPQKAVNSTQMVIKEVDVYANPQENNTTKRYTRPSLVANSRIKKSKKPLKLESRTNSVISEQGGEDYFRLPPILGPFLDQNKDSPVSTSSLGPNVDSGSSIYSSDNEEKAQASDKDTGNKLKPEPEESIVLTVVEDSTPIIAIKSETEATGAKNNANENNVNGIENARIEEQVIIEEKVEIQVSLKSSSPTPPPPPPSKEGPGPNLITDDHLNPIDKQSVISNASAKSNESLVTNVSPSDRGEKCRSAMPRRQNTISSISSNRAQTARNTNNNNINSNTGNTAQKAQPKAERDREQGGDYLIEICGRYLNVYGYGALKFIDKQWNVQKAADVHTVKFSYINYNNITAVLGKVKTRFPNAENFLFRETNIYCLGQLNALAETQGLVSLGIDSEGNSIMNKSWRSYAIYRLSHWGLKIINEEEITEDEVHAAEAMYTGLSDLVLWSLPEALLQPLLIRLRLEETCQASKMTAKEWLMQAEASLKSVVGKEALQWKKNGQYHEETAIREKGKKHFTFMMENTCNAVEKLQRLDTLWPSVLSEMIRTTLIDYSQIDAYVKNLMQELLK